MVPLCLGITFQQGYISAVDSSYASSKKRISKLHSLPSKENPQNLELSSLKNRGLEDNSFPVN